VLRLNLRGIRCPFVLLEIIEAMEANPEDVVMVECDDDRAVHHTVPALCDARGYSCEVESSWGTVCRLRLQPSPA
jgi:TusA-related sulfurtransferase